MEERGGGGHEPWRSGQGLRVGAKHVYTAVEVLALSKQVVRDAFLVASFEQDVNSLLG